MTRVIHLAPRHPVRAAILTEGCVKSKFQINDIFYFNKKTNMTSRISCVREAIDKALHDDKQIWTKYFAMAEAKTGVKRIQIFIGTFWTFIRYLSLRPSHNILCQI